MTQKRGHYGSGTIDQSGENSWRLRYRIGGKRYTKVFHGTKTEAQKELRGLLHAGDRGAHVAPAKITVAQWIDQWLALKGQSVKGRTAERYSDILRLHVASSALGTKPLQKLTATDVDGLYTSLHGKLAAGTLILLHITLKSCLSAAVRKDVLVSNPVAKAERPASEDDEKVGRVLDEEELTTLVHGFRGTSLYPIVAVAAFTGARRNEVLALRWVDLDLEANTMSITRSIEETKQHGRRVKGPKTARGVRKITIDAGLVELLRRERERHLRLVAGIPDGVEVDLSLVKLPDGALVFPAIGVDLTALRCPNAVTKLFVLRARKLGFPGLRFHDLRGSHETLLLDKGVPVHVVAERCGHDPAMLLKAYARRTKKSDTSAANIIGTMTKGLMG
jgi:integrase